MSSTYLEWTGDALDSALWQGIEFLEIEFVEVGGVIVETVVTANLARPASGISADGVRVSGGRRITELEFSVDAIADGDTSIVVRFPNRGDRSDYAIELISGGDDPLHPLHRCSFFNFYVNCPAGDCRPAGGHLAEPLPKRPAVDLLAKDYRGFQRVLSEWIRVHNPHWSDLAPASFERVMLDLVAHQGDMLSYYQDRVANEAFIDTARTRHAMRQHGVLLDYDPFDGLAARSVLSFDVTNAGFVPVGLEVGLARTSDEAPVVFAVRQRTAVIPEHNWGQLQLAAWPGAESASLATGGRELLLIGHDLQLEAGLRLAIVQGDFYQVLTLSEVEEASSPGWVAQPSDPPHNNDVDVTRVIFDPPLRSALFPWRGETLAVFGNLVDCVQGALRVAWLSPASPPPRQDMVVEPTRQTATVVPHLIGDTDPIPQMRALEVPLGRVLFDQGEAGRESMIDVLVDGVEWIRVEHLHNSESFDNHYVVSADESGRLWLLFGDGVQGRAIEVDGQSWLPGFEIELRFRIGEPLLGNCALDTLSEITPPRFGAADFDALGSTRVTNVTPGTGGLPPQDLEMLRQAIPTSLRHGKKQRAVSLEDYAEVARDADPRVARAAAIALGGPFSTVAVLVDPEGQVDLSEDLRLTVESYLEERRMAGREVVVIAADYVPLEVDLAVCVEPGFLEHEVRDRVLTALRPGSGQTQGYFHPDQLSFGEDVELGDLLAFVQCIAGVRSVKANRFRRLNSASSELVADRIELGTVEVARLDADDSFPENGVLILRVAGLDDFSQVDFEIGLSSELST